MRLTSELLGPTAGFDLREVGLAAWQKQDGY